MWDLFIPFRGRLLKKQNFQRGKEKCFVLKEHYFLLNANKKKVVFYGFQLLILVRPP